MAKIPNTRVIYKYPLPKEVNEVVMPGQHPKLLHVGEQDGVPHLWALHERPEKAVGQHKIYVFTIPTGAPLPITVCTAHYLGTVQMKSGLVWHLFSSSMPNLDEDD